MDPRRAILSSASSSSALPAKKRSRAPSSARSRPRTWGDEAAGLGHDPLVDTGPGRQAVAGETGAGAIEVDVLRDAQPGIALDVRLLVLRAVPGDVDLQDEVRPLPSSATIQLFRSCGSTSATASTSGASGAPPGRRRRSGTTGRCAALHLLEIPVEGVEGAARGLPVGVALVGQQIQRDLDREHRHHPGALVRGHPLPLLHGGRPRILGIEDIAGGEGLDHAGSIADPTAPSATPRRSALDPPHHLGRPARHRLHRAAGLGEAELP